MTPLVGILGAPNQANVALVAGLRAAGVGATHVTAATTRHLEPGDVLLNRLDVLPTLDGVEPGLELVAEAGARGVRVLNDVEGLLNAHDKLRTAVILAHARIPHPRTTLVCTEGALDAVATPAVLKPRFGSWGRDVFLCWNERELADCFAEIATRSWFACHGVLAQELVAAENRDLRLVVAGGTVVAVVERRAQGSEWRTNVSLGATVVPAVASPEAIALAVAAARALGADLVGIDLLPASSGPVVIEANGAVDFDGSYAASGDDLYPDIIEALRLPRAAGDERGHELTTSVDRRGSRCEMTLADPLREPALPLGAGRRTSR